MKYFSLLFILKIFLFFHRNTYFVFWTHLQYCCHIYQNSYIEKTRMTSPITIDFSFRDSFLIRYFCHNSVSSMLKFPDFYNSRFFSWSRGTPVILVISPLFFWRIAPWLLCNLMIFLVLGILLISESEFLSHFSEFLFGKGRWLHLFLITITIDFFFQG